LQVEIHFHSVTYGFASRSFSAIRERCYRQTAMTMEVIVIPRIDHGSGVEQKATDWQ
jgi:hypothetical protein